MAKQNDFLDPASIIIVGGGLSGCALATALSDGHRHILVLEAREGKNPRFNGELIHPTGVDVLAKDGMLPALKEAGGSPILGFACVPAVQHAATLLPYREISESAGVGFAIDHHDLVDVMRAHAAAQPGVEIRFGERVKDVVRREERVIGVITDSDERLTAQMVLGCDGRHSKLRSLIQVNERARLLSFTAAALLRNCPLPHPQFGHIFLGAWGPILAYPINQTDARACIDLPADIERGRDRVIARLRTSYLQHLPGGVRVSLERALDESGIEIAANYSISTDECTVPGAALIGDAAGCSHPLTATGMTIALNDTRLVASALEGIDLADCAKVDAALKKYEEERYHFVRAREILAGALYEVFRGADEGTRAIRDGIFRYWDSSTRGRARSMALLSGAESRLPAFMREYLTVVGMSTSSIIRGQKGHVSDQTMAGKVRSLVGLGKKSFEKLGLVAKGVRDGSLRWTQPNL